jgi:hypothetical protein
MYDRVGIIRSNTNITLSDAINYAFKISKGIMITTGISRSTIS